MSAEIAAWLNEAQATADAATEGPWDCDDESIGAGATWIAHLPSSFGTPFRPADGIFIADARTRIPQAIAALRAAMEFAADCEADPRRHALADDLTAAIAAALGVKP